MNLPEKTRRAANLLEGKVISSVKKISEKEIFIEFTNETRLIIDWKEDGIELLTGEPFVKRKTK